MLAAGVAPMVVPSAVLRGQPAPGRKIRLGHIGVGNEGTSVLYNFLAVEGVESVAVADPFRSRGENAVRIIAEQQGGRAKWYNDFRELLASADVDAVVVCTPDHWHVPIALHALRAGKDIYLEKPLGYSLDQNRLVRDAVKRTGRVFQYGTQQRSQELIKRGIELVRNGYIGELQHVEVWAPGGTGGGSTAEIPVPEGLDYNLYIGPAPMRPCSADRLTSSASWYCQDYALGFIAGWGAHPLDLAIQGMSSDLKGPYRVRGTGTFPPATDLFNACKTWDVSVSFADGIPMRFMSPDVAMPMVRKYRRATARTEEGTPYVPGNGTTFHGTKGWVSVSREASEASNPDWLRMRQCEGTDRVVYKPNYYAAFIDSVRTRGDLIAPIDDAVRSDALSHLSIIAIESGSEVVWDPAAYRITSSAALDARRSRPMRGDWLKV